MASSRIFIKGLPPSFTEPELKKHFSSQGREVTDVRLFANRRIGYVGYKTSEDAQKAVKYFNKTFVRMSRIGVEIARPVAETKENANSTRKVPTAQAAEHTAGQSFNGSLQDQSTSTESKPEADDEKLKEFLDVMKPKSKKRAWENDGLHENPIASHDEATQPTIAGQDAPSDDEYVDVPKPTKRAKLESNKTEVDNHPTEGQPSDKDEEDAVKDSTANVDDTVTADPSQPPVSDSDWARSRTSRLLGLLDDEEEEDTDLRKKRQTDNILDSDDGEEPSKGNIARVEEIENEKLPTPPSDDHTTPVPKADTSPELDAVRSSMRLFLRNLPYNVKVSELEAEFSEYGQLEEVHIPLDPKTSIAKGFAYVQFTDPDAAATAFLEKDGQTFQGRLLHIIPAAAKRENKLDDFELSKLPLKKQAVIKKRREAALTTFNWNALYMNADTVVSSVAARLGLSKSEVLDPTSSDAAVKQAHAETHIIQETKVYFKSQGVDLDAFKKSQRGDTAILIKNIPYDCSREELQRLFGEHGDLKRFIMPPSGVIAIVEYPNAAQAKTAFGSLAYRKIKGSVLFLEKAPKGLFSATPTTIQPSAGAGEVVGEDGVTKIAIADLKGSEPDMIVADIAGTATLFVRNLNFETSSQQLTDIFQPLSGFLSARVKTKTDPKKPGQILSMGFGFLEFQTASNAQAALKAMDGYSLHGHKLQIRASHKGVDAAETRRKADRARKDAGKRTKIIIKNLPFEATKKDLQSLFGAYGQLRSLRVPKKMDRNARGFAFADFTTPKEAESAMDALRDTHLLGRRLVLDFAAEEPEDAEAEIEKMAEKVGRQVNKVALQKLTSGGRKKFATQNDEEEG